MPLKESRLFRFFISISLKMSIARRKKFNDSQPIATKKIARAGVSAGCFRKRALKLSRARRSLSRTLRKKSLSRRSLNRLTRKIAIRKGVSAATLEKRVAREGVSMILSCAPRKIGRSSRILRHAPRKKRSLSEPRTQESYS